MAAEGGYAPLDTTPDKSPTAHERIGAARETIARNQAARAELEGSLRQDDEETMDTPEQHIDEEVGERAPLVGTKEEVLSEEVVPVERNAVLDKKQSLREAEERHAATLEATGLPLEAKIQELWSWAEGTRSGCLGRCGERYVKHGEIESMAEAGEMEIGEVCELLGAEPVRGPRAVLDGRAGTVINRREEDGVEKVQVWWEDDGAESGYIKVTDLDEPLGVGREAFAAACRAQPKPRDAGPKSDQRKVEVWFETLRLELES
eukprot:COSAG04_NODE_2033_length_4964_cov_102.344913_3_plen_262_part_00